MSFAGPPDFRPLLPVIHTLSPEAAGGYAKSMGTTSLTSTAWGTNNTLAVGVPFVLPFAFTVAKIGWANAGTVTGTVDAGVYDEAGNRIFSARHENSDTNINHASASAVQSQTVTGQTLPPGRYYFFFTLSATTATILMAPTTAVKGRAAGLVVATVSSAVLASTLTYAVYNQTTGIPFMGITSRSTQF